MLKKKEEKELDPTLIAGVNATRQMLMIKGYFVKNILRVSDSIVDLIALRECLIDSERLRVRLVLPQKGSGLSIPAIRNFMNEQARVFDLSGLLISLGSISMQAKQFANRKDLPVKDLNWLKENSDFAYFESITSEISE